jgi:hypothetical protein
MVHQQEYNKPTKKITKPATQVVLPPYTPDGTPFLAVDGETQQHM